MDWIFIDTSVFEANNFLDSRRIKQILSLAQEGVIKIVIPDITYREIKRRVVKNTSDAVGAFNKFSKEGRILRNIPELLTRFGKINTSECVGQVTREIDEVFNRSNIEIIPSSVTDIAPVFEAYFNQTPPFGTGIKKSEFPDAFALKTVEKYGEESNKKIIVLSKDGDMLTYESMHLIVMDFDSYVDDLLRKIEKSKHQEMVLELIDKMYNENKDSYNEQLEQWIEELLDEENSYNRYTNYMYIHSLSHSVYNIEISDYQITSISDDRITLEANADISFSVELIYDNEEFGIYDDEERTWSYYDTVEDTIDKTINVVVELVYEIPQAGKEFAELRIEEINNGKDIEL